MSLELHIILYCSFNRHVSRQKSEYLGLSEENQRQNSLNIRVNAQVMAVITMLEFCGGCLFVVGRIFRLQISFGSFSGTILAMLLYFVILPYAFLMNTRYNKSRIIEEGWMNVLKNMAFSYKPDAVIPANISTKASNGDEKPNNTPMKPAVPRIFIIPNTRESSMAETNILNTANITIEDDNEEPDFEIQQPTCSYGVVDLENDSYDCIEKGKGFNTKLSINTIREKMIADLLSNINNEDMYIKKLTHFVDIEQAHKSGKDIDTLNCDYEHLRVDTLPHFVGCRERKLDLRNTKLQKLFRCRKDNDTYQIYFEQFVDMEENFLENGC